MKEIEKRIEEILSKMTLTEKIGQLNQISTPLEDDEAIFDRLRRGEVGSFIMSTTACAGNDGAEAAGEELLNKLQRIAVEESRLGIPVIFGRDVIHGHNTVMPVPIGSAASFNEGLVKDCYRAVGREAARDGVNWTFSPMVDMSRDPRWGRCVEGSGEDPYLASKMAKAVVEGFQGEDLSKEDCIVACAKHYIGYGASEGGRDYHRTEISDYTLRNWYLPAFKAAVDSGVGTVMSSFNDISGQPVTSSRYLLTELLKKELGFNGFIVSDWCAVGQLIDQGVAENEKQAAELSINAGLDMEMATDCYLENLKQLVSEGKVSEEQIDDSVRRILRIKLMAGLFERPYIPKYTIDFNKHKELALSLAQESVVMLKNEGGVLPLKENSHISLSGKFATDRNNMLGTWCLDGKAEDVTTVLEGVKRYTDKIRTDFCGSMLNESRYTSDNSDETMVICLGEESWLTGEANSIADIEISERDLSLARMARSTGKKVVAVLFFARPVAMEKIEPYCDAILYAWHLGTEAGNAVADILFGKANPSGKLPMTLPRITGQIPLYYNATPTARPYNGYYGSCNRNYHDCSGTPMYRFGYGLSYSEFDISIPTANKNTITLDSINSGEKFEISVDIKNISNVLGSEVVQLYLRDKVATMTRPLRELKGYKKITLSPSQSKTVKFNLGFDELGFYGSDSIFAVEKGEFEIYIGNDCYADKKLTIKVV